MKLSHELKRFLAEYEDYRSRVLKPAHAELKSILGEWEKPDYWNKYAADKVVAGPSPVRMTLARIKHPDKVVDKIYRKPELFPHGLQLSTLHRMHDVIGARVIVYFTSQLPLIDREIRNSNLFEISETSPPEAYYDDDILTRLGLSHIHHKNKESGYSSLHYVLKLRHSSISEKERPFFELQVRTMAQDLWCELEHVLSYKPEHRTHFSAKRRFQILSKEIGAIDEHFNLLYEDLIHNQETASYKDSDMLNFENLPKVAMEIGFQCALTDLNPILRILFSRNIMTIGELLRIASPRRLITIRNTYVSIAGQPPNNIELVSALVSLKGAKSKEVEIERVKSQIEYHRSQP